jgi:hypothetical protein
LTFKSNACSNLVSTKIGQATMANAIAMCRKADRIIHLDVIDNKQLTEMSELNTYYGHDQNSLLAKPDMQVF